MKFFNRYNWKKVIQPSNPLPSATDPQYKDDCDINVVIDRFLRGGPVDNIAKRNGSYGDVSKYDNFHQMMDVVTEGLRAFQDVPSAIRARFGNDPKAFFDFATNPDNKEELVKLGLATVFTPEVESPIKVQVVNPTRGNDAPSRTT